MNNYADTWANNVMKMLYTPREGDDTLIFYHSRLPLEFSVDEWFEKYPASEYNIRLDYLTLTAYVELKPEKA